MKHFAAKALSTVVLWVSSAIFAATAQAEEDGRVNGTTPAGRMAALRGYCASIPVGSLREARAAMSPLAAKIYSGQEVESSLKAWGQLAATDYTDSKARLDKNPKDNNTRNPFQKHALIHAYLVCRDRAAITSSFVDDMKPRLSRGEKPGNAHARLDAAPRCLRLESRLLRRSLKPRKTLGLQHHFARRDGHHGDTPMARERAMTP